MRVEIAREISARANEVLTEAQRNPLFAEIENWPAPDISISSPIYHGTGSLALLGSSVRDLEPGILLPQTNYLGTSGNTISFAQNPELAASHALGVAHVRDLVVDSTTALSYSKEIQSGFLGSENKRTIVWNDALYHYMNPNSLRTHTRDLRRAVSEGDLSQRDRMMFLENLLRKSTRLTDKEKKAFEQELRNQFPVVIAIEGDGLPVTDGQVAIHGGFPTDRLRFMEVPYSHIAQVEEAVRERGLEISVIPLELRELQRLKRLAGFSENFASPQDSEMEPGITMTPYYRRELQAHYRRFYSLFAEITQEALGMLPGDARDVFKSFDLLIFAEVGEQVVGYAGYSRKTVPGVGVVLDQEARMMRRGYQAAGYGRKLLIKALSLVPDAKYLTFSTQNPGAILSTRKVLPDAQFTPLDAPYEQDPEIASDLVAIASSGSGKRGLDFATGVRKGLYEQKLGDYEVDMSNPGVAKIEERFAQLGVNRDAGDAVFVMVKLDSPFIILSKYLSEAGEAQEFTRIDLEEILSAVIEGIDGATSSVQMTMNLAEEIATPLPHRYHALLKDKLDKGVQITRVGFGTNGDFQIVQGRHDFSSSDFRFVHYPRTSEYQRMIMIDGRRIFFRTPDGFYTTGNPEVIKRFQDYFTTVSTI